MATAPMKSPPLHNFPVSFLQWGHRCRRIPEPPSLEPTPATAERERSWNLRPRKGATVENSGVGAAVTEVRSARLRGLSEGQVAERKDLWVSLSREEIEEDVYAMTGGKASRRPRKRAKIVQKQLDSVFPGLYLVGITADAYRVDEATKEKQKQKIGE